MYGTVAGDIIGSRFERASLKSKEFALEHEDNVFTDDTLLSIATAEALMGDKDFTKAYHTWGNRYKNVGFGKSFIKWLSKDNPQPYNSWGNGSAMRVGPIGWYAQTLEECLELARASAVVTHNHEEGIKGAEATAAAVFLARTGKSKAEIKDYISENFGYDLDRTVDEMRPEYRFHVSCQKSVPESIICFLESDSVEDAIRTAISMGGDADTMAAIAGSIAEAFYGGVPDFMLSMIRTKLPEDLLEVAEQFAEKHM